MASTSTLTEMATTAFKHSSFTCVGHLLHVNLRDQLLAHKEAFGHALLERNKRALAVVNKVNTINNAYRFFDYEIIAKRDGCELSDDELMVVEVVQNKHRFKFNFGQVYWNSRLSTEHQRIYDKFKRNNDIVFDVFAGVGPFAVPAAKKRCQVYANDLNPESVRWLKENFKRNKAPEESYEIFNLDAKEFISEQLKPSLLGEYDRIAESDNWLEPVVHIIMNLPALAPTFLPHFVGLFHDEFKQERLIGSQTIGEFLSETQIRHVIYCYCFLKGVYEDPQLEVKRMIEEQSGHLVANNITEVFRVRNVAPYKEMYRVEIDLTQEIMSAPKAPVSILKHTTNGTPKKDVEQTNGTPKKVTIHPKTAKRSRSESCESLNNSSKKNRFGDYCSIM